MANFSERMIGAALLQVSTYEEVEADTSATGQAILVVAASSLAAGVSAFGLLGISGFLKSTVMALIGWVVWVGLIYFIGAKLLPEPQTRVDMGELLRTTGFASSAGILKILGIIPLLGWILSFAISLWVLVCMVIAVRQALDYQSTGRAIGVCALGFIANIIINMVFGGFSLLSGF